MSDLIRVKAVHRGYFGGLIREPGDEFEAPVDMASNWWEPVEGEAFGGAGDHDGDGKPGGSLPGEASTVKRGKKAKAETVAAPVAEPFADAPQPVRVQNEVNDATGGTQPDWVAPVGGDI